MTGINIIEQCEQMTDEELIRALTVSKSEYTEEFYSVAEAELKKRGKEIGAILNNVKYRSGTGEKMTLSIEASVEKLDQGFKLWEAGRFTNCLNQRMTIQRASRCWSGSYQCEAGADFFIARSDSRVKNILKKFLNLDDWQKEIADNFMPERWTILTGVSSYGFLNRLCEDLSGREVPAAAKVEAPESRACYTGNCEEDDGPIKVFVEKADMDTAKEVLSDLKKVIDDLFEEAEALDGKDDIEKELAVYDQLFELVPDDETVAFNRGVILFDQERNEDAAESFIVAAFNRNDQEIRQESEAYLVRILDELPQNLTILHSLASLAMENGDADAIENYYKKIIEIAPEDALAHLNLGHFYFANTSDDVHAKEHFKAFLDLDPDSDEAEEVKEILAELG